jgi:cysteine synthase A
MRTTVSLAVCVITVTAVFRSWRRRRRKTGQDDGSSGYESLIGNTPLIKLERLSTLLGHGKCVYVKMESMNPGGSGKDRAALYLIRSAEINGDLPLPIAVMTSAFHEDHLQRVRDAVSLTSYEASIKNVILDAISRTRTGGIVVEGSSGSTGISLATLAAQRGHSVIIVMPDDQAQEKRTILDCLGASVHVVPTAAISNPNHYVNVAKRITEFINVMDQQQSSMGNSQTRYLKAAFMNQFENLANYEAHFNTTGPEIMDQTRKLCGKYPDACKYSSRRCWCCLTLQITFDFSL